MLEFIKQKLSEAPTAAYVVISVAVVLFSGFLMTRITKKLKLPNVTAYILAGIIIGPACLGFVNERFITGTEFIADIALAFIAFGTGEYFRFSVIKRNGPKVIVIAVIEALLSSILIFAVCFFLLKLELGFSLILAALAAATAPASTVMTIRQTGAKGDFVDTLLQVIALDIVISLLAFGMAVSVSQAMATGSVSVMDALKPLITNLAVMALGALFGYIMKWLMPKNRSTDNRLIISIALLFTFCGICTFIDVSPLLGCMSMGMIYINVTNNDKLFKQLNYFSPPFLLIFFVRSGANFRLDALLDGSVAVGALPLIVIGLIYFALRIVGKYFGVFLGSAAVKKSSSIRKYLGLALIPQAGVAIGLSAIGARSIGGEVGAALETIILASSVLYELVGPPLAKLSLHLSGSFSEKLEDLTPEVSESRTPEQTEVDILVARINAIREDMPKKNEIPDEEEEAFTEAAEEMANAIRLGIINKRILK